MFAPITPSADPSRLVPPTTKKAAIATEPLATRRISTPTMNANGNPAAPIAAIRRHVRYPFHRSALSVLNVGPTVYAGYTKLSPRLSGCAPIAIGGIADHFHRLARMNPTTSVAALVHQVNGATTHEIQR